MNREEFFRFVSRKEFANRVSRADLPAFFYVSSIVQKKVADLVGCLPAGFETHYAFKANPNREVVRFLCQLGLGADVASIGELRLAQAAGYAAERIEMTGPGKTDDELAAAIDMNISCINAESILEIVKIAEIAQSKGKTARIGIRLNPSRRAVESRMKMGEDTQFGMIEDDLAEAFRIIRSRNRSLEFVGFHMHLGSQFLRAEKLVANFRFVLEKSYEIARQYGVVVQKINFGGGWGIDVFAKTPPLDLAVMQKGLAQLFDEDPFKEFSHGIKRIVEPGRFLVAECGVYAAKILYRKRGYQKEFLILDGGMHHLYGAAGGIGQVIRRNYEMDAILKKEENGDARKFQVTGSLCIPDDIMASEVELPHDIEPGDILLFFNCGAYGATASPLQFLSHPPPQEYLLA